MTSTERIQRPSTPKTYKQKSPPRPRSPVETAEQITDRRILENKERSRLAKSKLKLIEYIDADAKKIGGKTRKRKTNSRKTKNKKSRRQNKRQRKTKKLI